MNFDSNNQLKNQPDKADLSSQDASESADGTPSPNGSSPQPEPSDSVHPLVLVNKKLEQSKKLLIVGLRMWRRKSDAMARGLVVRDQSPLIPFSNSEAAAPRPPSFIRRHALLLLCVVIPTFLSIIYFGLYASDIYVSEAAYIVRSPNKQTTASGLGAMLQGAGFSGFSRAQDDVYTVSEYVASRDAMNFLNEKLNLEESWSSGKIDLFNRFDPIGWDSSNEALYEYYLKRVTVTVDAVSGITTLTASVFNPEQAYEINKTLLTQAEELVNLLNERGRNDLIRFAENEVRIAEDRAKAAANAVSNYRNTQAVVDPEKQTQLHYEQISRLQEELVKTRAQLAQLKVFAPKSPHPPALELREKTIENEIQKEMEKITGGENSLASKAAEFERLALEREFADRQLAGALTSLESARNEAQRQQLYLETISKPNLPDEAVLPKRIRGILTVLVLGMLSWGILSMFLAGIREHHY